LRKFIAILKLDGGWEARVEFRKLEDTQVRSELPLLRQLREHLSEEELWGLYQAAQKESGYTLWGAFDQSHCLGLMGARILTDFVHGRHLYIDDLVVAESARSKGIGAYLLSEAKKLASAEGCAQLRLCTGIQNERGKSFYERNGLSLRAVAYKAKL
jgi:ribosomal protein S18 acetylase RimI-like enzyme